MLVAQALPFTPAPVTPPIAATSAGLQVQGIMASRPGDPRTYVLLGSGFLRALTAPSIDGFVARWLAAHPAAAVRPISRILMTNTRSHRQQEIVYVWIEDGPASLNVDMVAAGMTAGATMADMVDNQRGLDELLKRPDMADARAEIARERAAAPQDRTERLIGDGYYASRVQRIAAAERRARLAKAGIWSDAMKDTRAAEHIR